MSIANVVADHKKEIIEAWEALHAIPELSTQELRTSALLQEYLKENALPFTAGLAGTGILATLDSRAPGPRLALRADMDALQHIEGDHTYLRHSCGHDAHMCIVLFAGILAKKMGLVQRGSLSLVFQPSEEEERTSGARALSRLGVVNSMDYLFGLHLRPSSEARRFQAITALKHSALLTVTGSFVGQGVHAGRQHLGKNPIDAAALAVLSVNSIRLDPHSYSSAKFTYLNSDSGTFSSIPDQASFRIDLRSAENTQMEILTEKVRAAVEHAALSTGCRAEIRLIPGLSASKYDPEAIAMLSEAVDEVFTSKGNLGIRETSGAEDFHEYVRANPALKTAYLGLGCDMHNNLHHPAMEFNKDALLDGIAIFLTLIRNTLAISH